MSKINDLEEELNIARVKIKELIIENLQLKREDIYNKQTIRSLHWALNTSTNQIRNFQMKHVEEFVDGKGIYSKESLSLAE